jgi:hypothetical protein
VKVECWEIVRLLIYIVCTSSHQKPPTYPVIHPSTHSIPSNPNPPIHLLYPILIFTRDGAVLTPVEWMIKRRASGKSGSEDTLRELFYNSKAHFSGFWGTRHRNRLWHRVTSWKVACSIAHEVVWFFNWPNLSIRAVALKSTQPITNLSARNLPDGNAWPARKGDYLAAICEPVFKKNVEPRSFTSLWASTACYRDNFTLVFSGFWKDI